MKRWYGIDPGKRDESLTLTPLHPPSRIGSVGRLAEAHPAPPRRSSVPAGRRPKAHVRRCQHAAKSCKTNELCVVNVH